MRPCNVYEKMHTAGLLGRAAGSPMAAAGACAVDVNGRPATPRAGMGADESDVSKGLAGTGPVGKRSAARWVAKPCNTFAERWSFSVDSETVSAFMLN